MQHIAAEMEHHLDSEVRNIPDMKANLLFQYKRPEFISRASGAEWAFWNQAYYRYTLDKEQHAMLLHTETKFGNDAIVLYAAPAAKDVHELVTLKRKNMIIDNTNFRRASELKDHGRLDAQGKSFRRLVVLPKPYRHHNA